MKIADLFSFFKPLTKFKTFSVSCIDKPIVGSSKTIKSELKYNDLPKATPCFSPPDKPIIVESTVIALDVNPM